jgi:hypothetical protein
MSVDSPTDFEELIRRVRDRATGGDAAALLRAGVAVSAEHAATADRLLDHFVAHARAAGMSWTDIGAQLGVSRQAARQRFADRPARDALPYAARTAPRLEACLDSAGWHARAEGAEEIGTQHLLAGLMAEGVAAAILENLHVSAEAIRSSSDRLFGASPAPATDEIPPMSTEAKCALDAAAVKAAASDSDNSAPEVRTEHLLAVLALDPGSRARRVLNDLDVDIAAVKRELQCYLTLGPSRPARWWKRRAPTQNGCSFCGRTLPGVGQLVRGPGVAICSACVALAADILDRQPTR